MRCFSTFLSTCAASVGRCRRRKCRPWRERFRFFREIFDSCSKSQPRPILGTMVDPSDAFYMIDAAGFTDLVTLRGSSATSAPASPARSVTSFLSRGVSLTSSLKGTVYNKDRHLTLLVIDDQTVDWLVRYVKVVRVDIPRAKNYKISHKALERIHDIRIVPQGALFPRT